MFDEMDLSEFKIKAVAGSASDQIPPTVDGYGWLLRLLTVRKEQTQSGMTAIKFNAQIISEGKWHNHIGDFRLFLGGRWPDSALAKFGSFAAACGLSGEVNNVSNFEGREVIVGFKLSENGKYSNACNWWQHTSDNRRRIALQAIPSWVDAPNAREAVKTGDVPF